MEDNKQKMQLLRKKLPARYGKKILARINDTNVTLRHVYGVFNGFVNDPAIVLQVLEAAEHEIAEMNKVFEKQNALLQQ